MQQYVRAHIFTEAEERANALIHGVGLILSGAGAIVLISLASLRGTAWHVVSCSIYATALILLYAASTLYHSVRSENAQRVFEFIDRSAIYLLIAGTYTPFTLVTLRGPWGWSIFGAVWGLAFVGITLQSIFGARFRKPSVAVYLLMGWTILVGAHHLLEAVTWTGIGWILAGGLFYTIGLVFYGWKRLPHSHAVWHGFVLVGSALHYVAVLLYVIPW